MSSRADVLGALLEGQSLGEAIVRSNAHVGSQLAAEQKRRGSLPGPAAYESAKHPRGAKGSGRGGQFVAKGSSGTAVKEVQKHLGVAQTGHFAFDTQAAVQNFQREHGLAVDGIVGAQTAQALLGNRNAKTVTPGALSAADRKALKLATTHKRSATSSTAAGKKTAAAKKKAAAKGTAPTRFGGGIVI